MSKRILVIDDDEDILAIMDIIFEEEGYQTILYNTGATAEQIKLLSPDLILLDVRITGFHKTGADICSEIREETGLNSVPILLVSAETNVDVLAKTCGASGYVNKPFDIDGLLSKVKELIS